MPLDYAQRDDGQGTLTVSIVFKGEKSNFADEFAYMFIPYNLIGN